MYVLVINSKIEKYPYTISQLRADNPNVSFPSNIEIDSDTLKSHNVHRVFSAPCPEYDRLTTKLVEKTPVLEDSKYNQAWEVVELSDEEKANNIEAENSLARSRRNQLLAASDWTQGKDISDEVSLAWQPYRQALRDITEQEGFPLNVVWPTQPE